MMATEHGDESKVVYESKWKAEIAKKRKEKEQKEPNVIKNSD